MSRVTSLRTIVADLVTTAGSVRYGLVAQSCSSATNFGLVVIAGQVLGPSGVGTLFVGFGAYLLLLGFQRGLVTDPLVVGSSAGDAAEREARAGFALTLALAGAGLAAGILAGIGLLLPEQVGRGMLLFAPWIVPALVQDLGRSIVFRDRSQRSTAFSDATWLLTMAATAPIAFTTASDWAVVACWGAGSIAGALVALRQIGWRPVPLREAIAWWNAEARSFGRWLWMSDGLYNVAMYSSVLALVSILGAREFGGLTAVQSAFAPLSLLGPALSLPGLPLVSRIARDSPRRALLVALQLGALITSLTAIYVAVLASFPDLLGIFFGHEFTAFRSIVIPIGIGQILTAPTFALTLFLKAQQRGRALFWYLSFSVLLNVILAVTFASFFGLTGAAWAGVVATSLYLPVLIAVIRPRKLMGREETACVPTALG
jgi:O-antigen/teichoic acid export membrane protein